MTTHLVIPDTQVGPDTPTDHLRWIGKYILDKKPDVVVHLGDHWDMRSLSYYDRGKKRAENQRYIADVAAGNAALTLLDEPTQKSNWGKRRVGKAEYLPRKVLLRGNHEDRIRRATEDDPKLDGALSMNSLCSRDWEVHDFLEVVEIDGVHYSHYFYNPMTGRPYGGSNVETRLKSIGHSFTMGHQQGLRYGMVDTVAGAKHGLVAGTCLTPDHKVLTADLRYVPLGEVKQGDKLVSFDEHVSGRSARRYRTGTVQATRLDTDFVYGVTLDNGKVLKVTGDHLWLTRVGGQKAISAKGTYLWRKTSELRRGTRIPQPLDEWETASDFGAGWLAGMYDGEGCYYTRTTSAGNIVQLTLSQKPGATLDRAIYELERVVGVEGRTHRNQRGVDSLYVKGGTSQIARVLGELRPTRLLPKFRPEHLGSMVTNRNLRVVDIEPLGRREIVRIAIDAGTMIVEGTPHHNCYLHNEDYLGPQGNSQWRGVVMCHEVSHGEYDIMAVSLNYLCHRYEGMSVYDYMGMYYPHIDRSWAKRGH